MVVASRLHRQKTLVLGVSFGEDDVERAAEEREILASSAEVASILENVDRELAVMAQEAIRLAVRERIHAELARLERGHTIISEDD